MELEGEITMDIISIIFRRRKVNIGKLIDFGFSESNGVYFYQTTLPSSGFLMTVEIVREGSVRASVIDTESNDSYMLHLTGASGSFVGNVKMEYEQALTKIAEKCFDLNIFKSAQAKETIAYVHDTFGDELEFLWKKFPDNAVWRRKDNRKWYGAVLTVAGRKIGLETDNIVEIIDLRMNPDDAETVLSREHYYPGWHMNKKSWYTVILDGSIPDEELKERIKESYELAGR